MANNIRPVYHQGKITFSENTKKESEGILGKDSVPQVQGVCEDYIGFKEEVIEKKPKKGEINKRLKEIHHHSKRIAELLSGCFDTQDELRLLVGKRLAADMCLIHEATKKYADIKVGRPKGSLEEAEWHLVVSLCQLYERITGKAPTVINTFDGQANNPIAKLVRVLKAPLNLQKDLSGIVNDASRIMSSR